MLTSGDNRGHGFGERPSARLALGAVLGLLSVAELAARRPRSTVRRRRLSRAAPVTHTGVSRADQRC